MKDNFVDKLKFDDHGLIAVVVQDNATNEVLTLAYMNDEALKKTIETGKTWFWRRSKERLMMKGSTSGHVQLVKDILIDCDADALIIKVKQIAGLLARRIRCYVQKGSHLNTGDKLGFIMFGSRVDIILPDTITLRVKLGQKVKGGESIIGQNNETKT